MVDWLVTTLSGVRVLAHLVTFFMIGDEPTLPLRLWAMMRVGFSPEINALVTMVLVGTMLLAASGALLMRRSIASKSAA